ncbi:hypothetical protein [Spongiivirga citrea]|uniref:Uncharacterized protein n=1 Tax=Spongiivirga citrea TaxID=1481457 RepID=A0A6M0CL85_9FLAO|nr:hypothetical protein [Spongiivirga citrea]NER18688.1 hypothetical protein [Spongiivirga citrea]
MQRLITKIVGLLFLTTLTSCLTDYQGQIPDETEFTATNYVYEGDLYKYYLEEQIEQNGNNASDNQLNFWKKELSNIIDLEQLGLDLIPPIPPCPRPRDCGYEALEYLLIDSNADRVEVLFHDQNNKTIGGGAIDEFTPMPEAKGFISLANLKIENYTDVYSIEVNVFANNKIIRSYLVE